MWNCISIVYCIRSTSTSITKFDTKEMENVGENVENVHTVIDRMEINLIVSCALSSVIVDKRNAREMHLFWKITHYEIYTARCLVKWVLSLQDIRCRTCSVWVVSLVARWRTTSAILPLVPSKLWNYATRIPVPRSKYRTTFYFYFTLCTSILLFAPLSKRLCCYLSLKDGSPMNGLLAVDCVVPESGNV